VNRTTIQSFKVTCTWILSGVLTAGFLGGLATHAATASGTFALTGSLNVARYNHTATLLPSGEVLVTGGIGVNGDYTSLASAELYNPKTGKWTLTGSVTAGRTSLTATLLQNGQVLVAGGSDYQIRCYATAELYNPSTGTWTLTGSMSQPRCLHSATLLPDGNVLVSGGVNSIYDTDTTTVSGSEIYNPATGTWTATGSLNVSRAEAATLLLDNGEVLSAGGYNNTGNSAPNTYLTSAELYNPSTQVWATTASMAVGAGLPSPPALLTNGDALIAIDAQFYIQGSATWSATGPLPTIANGPTKAVALANGNVLGTGCQCKSTNPRYPCRAASTAVADLYSFSTNAWSQTGSMSYSRFSQTMTLLSNGQVLVAGGYERPPTGYSTVLSSAELYTP
jgi:Galactose oxidase, central domain/Kelch motif